MFRYVFMISPVTLLSFTDGTPFGNKEAFMLPMNQWLEDNISKLNQYLQACGENPEEKPQISRIFIKKVKWEIALNSIATVFMDNAGKWYAVNGAVFDNAQRVIDL